VYIFGVEHGQLSSAIAVVEDNLTRMRQLGNQPRAERGREPAVRVADASMRVSRSDGSGCTPSPGCGLPPWTTRSCLPAPDRLASRSCFHGRVAARAGVRNIWTSSRCSRAARAQRISSSPCSGQGCPTHHQTYIKSAARGRDRPTIMSAEGPPRVHERENTRGHPANRRGPESFVLRGFLCRARPR
jgi:hypothetical protein